MAEKYLMFSLDDDESKKVAEVIGNKTCKKIINLLAEKELSETDIARELGMNVSTIEYNLKKLIKTGIIEKTKTFFWSIKGKKIPTYKAANKHIIISPKSSKPIKNIFIVAIASVIVAFFIKLYSSSKVGLQATSEKAMEFAPAMMEQAESVANTVIRSPPAQTFQTIPQIWPWFLAGALFALLILLILNWKKL